MFPFGGKKKEDEEEEEDILDQDLLPKRKFKDLKSVNKRKRKEPIKPWGKSERILVLIVLGVTVIASATLSLISRGIVNLPKLSLSSLPNFSVENNSNLSFNSFFGGTFTFEKTDKNECCQKAILEFKNLTDDLSGDYGFYVIRLDGLGEYGLNEEDPFVAASLKKVPAAVALYKQSEEGQINLDAKYTLQDSDKVGGNGSLVNYKSGTAFTYRQLAKFMLSESDNTAFNIFEKILGDRKIQDTIISLGMKNTSVYDDITTPKDMASVFRIIKNGEVLNRQDSDEILSYMKGTKFDSWLEAGVPKDIPVEHKYGNEPGVVDDAGIVYSKNPYIVVVMSRDVDEIEANSVFPKISKAIYDFEVAN